MKIALILGGAFLVGLAILIWGGGTPKSIRHRQLSEKRLDSLVALFARQGFEGATLVVQENDSGRFFQIRKELSGGKLRLRSDFPYAPWSEPYYDRFRRALDSIGVKVSETSGTANIEMHGNVSKTLTIDFGYDTGTVVRVIELLFRDVYELDLRRDGELIMTRINPIRQDD